MPGTSSTTWTKAPSVSSPQVMSMVPPCGVCRRALSRTLAVRALTRRGRSSPASGCDPRLGTRPRAGPAASSKPARCCCSQVSEPAAKRDAETPRTIERGSEETEPEALARAPGKLEHVGRSRLTAGRLAWGGFVLSAGSVFRTSGPPPRPPASSRRSQPGSRYFSRSRGRRSRLGGSGLEAREPTVAHAAPVLHRPDADPREIHGGRRRRPRRCTGGSSPSRSGTREN